VALNQRGDASKGPAFIAKTLGTSPLASQLSHLLALCRIELGLTAGRPFGVEAHRGVLLKGIAPPTDSARGGLDMASDLSDAPASLSE
jgi:hypothetical protein